MKRSVQLAEVQTKQGEVLSLCQHDGDFEILVNGDELMSTRRNYSEQLLGQLGMDMMASRPSGSVLIGGLGLGYTLASVLERLGNRGAVVVAELLPEIVEWNRAFLREVNGHCLEDERVHIHTGNVVPYLREAKPAHFDLILLDVDNGPEALVSPENQWLYGDYGLKHLQRVLTRRGRVIFWSAGAFPPFEKKLRRAGFRTKAVPAKAYPNAKREAYMLYVADKS